MGSVKYTFTFVPFCLPGINLGNDVRTRNASLSQSGSSDLTTSGFTILPVLVTTKRNITFP